MSDNIKYYNLQYPINKSSFVASLDSTLLSSDFSLNIGDNVIAETQELGAEIMLVTSFCQEAASQDAQHTAIIKRLADENDFKRQENNTNLEKKFLERVQKSIENEKLDINVISVHKTLYSDVLFVYYTADGRVDFRNFVKNAYQNIGMKVCMRQINARDIGRFFTGCGLCGRKVCCSCMPSVTQKTFVSVKTLKEQNIIPASGKNTGLCGLLCCCMDYESEYYKLSKPFFPKEGDEITQNGDVFVVCDINYISGKIRAKNKDDSCIAVFNNKDIKKNSNGSWLSVGGLEKDTSGT